MRAVSTVHVVIDLKPMPPNNKYRRSELEPETEIERQLLRPINQKVANAGPLGFTSDLRWRKLLKGKADNRQYYTRFKTGRKNARTEIK